MKTIIAGSREYQDYEFMAQELNNVDFEITEVVSGTARGADRLGEKWADDNGMPIFRMPANWDQYGKAAGYIRNEEMAKCSDALVAFWDGKSMGTKHMIDLAKKYDLKIKVVLFK
jgi:hypothetical protein|tara:strand:- start:1112 stop:1456 length:345 start_codon:yes stop_codon:yes gene_type:complete